MGVSLISNPPYNMRWTVPQLASFMPQYMGYVVPPKNNANYAFILTALNLIDEKAVFLLPNAVLGPGSREEQEIRRQLIAENVISAIIALPGSMFESTSIPVCIILFDRHKQTQKIEMIDMRKTFITEARYQNGQYGESSHMKRTYCKNLNVITPEGMEKAIEAIQNLASETGFCRAVTLDEIRSNDYALAPGRYVEIEAVEEKHRPFADIVADYNRIIRQKNAIQIRMNRTAAKRIGFDCMDIDKPDLTETFALVKQKPEKECFITFGADDGIKISISTKDGIHPLILDFLGHWKQMIMYLNTEENRLLAELRDALLPELMRGEIEVTTAERSGGQ